MKTYWTILARPFIWYWKLIHTELTGEDAEDAKTAP